MDLKKCRIQTTVLALSTLVMAGCNAANGPSPQLGVNSPLPPGSTSPSPTGITPPGKNPPPPIQARSYSTDALLFVGDGTWSSEIASIESILSSHGATYQATNSAQLDAFGPLDMAKYGVMIFPGGAGGTEAGSLSAQTHANIRQAVQKYGVSYVGFCAGAFIAAAPAPAAGKDVSYGLGVVNTPLLPYYTLENQGIDIAMTLYSFADGTQADILYYGGPVTPNVPGGVIAKYPNGDPAISEMWSGAGLVVISGGHPTATQAILNALGVTSSDGTHLDIAWNLINAALHQQPLPAF